jgi:hypothetical protein
MEQNATRVQQVQTEVTNFPERGLPAEVKYIYIEKIKYLGWKIRQMK